MKYSLILKSALSLSFLIIFSGCGGAKPKSWKLNSSSEAIYNGYKKVTHNNYSYTIPNGTMYKDMSPNNTDTSELLLLGLSYLGSDVCTNGDIIWYLPLMEGQLTLGSSESPYYAEIKDIKTIGGKNSSKEKDYDSVSLMSKHIAWSFLDLRRLNYAGCVSPINENPNPNIIVTVEDKKFIVPKLAKRGTTVLNKVFIKGLSSNKIYKCKVNDLLIHNHVNNPVTDKQIIEFMKSPDVKCVSPMTKEGYEAFLKNKTANKQPISKEQISTYKPKYTTSTTKKQVGLNDVLHSLNKTVSKANADLNNQNRKLSNINSRTDNSLNSVNKPYTTRDAFGNIVKSDKNFVTKDAFGNQVKSNSKHTTRDAFGNIVKSTDCYTAKDAFGNFVKTCK